MAKEYKQVMFGLAIAGLSTFVATTVMAQEVVVVPARAPQSLLERLEDAFFSNDRTFYQNRSIPRQLSYIAGPGILIRNSFPDNEIARDGAAVNEFYREALARQTSGPILRSADLINPFNLSVRTLPVSDQPLPSGVVISPLPDVGPPNLPSQGQPTVPALW